MEVGKNYITDKVLYIDPDTQKECIGTSLEFQLPHFPKELMI